MRCEHGVVRVLSAADAALLLETADLDEAVRMLPALVDAALPGVTELVPAARTILVRFDPTLVPGDRLAARLLEIEPVAARASSDRAVSIPVRYDGQDLAEVAQHLGVSTEEVVARHQRASWTVAFSGFAPGFGYLLGDDPLFDVPRRPSPRTRVPAGSVGLAGRFSGVYPKESPGGWQLIGRTDAVLWDLERDPPALLAPGTTVRFERAERDLVAARAAPAAPARAPVTAAHAVEVARPGLQLLVQDLGRPGLAAHGVSASGAADRSSLREANRAVGNEPRLAGLELAGGGAVLRFRGPAVIALAGALADAAIASSVPGGREGHPVEPQRPVALDDGDELRIGRVRDGLRVIIAIRGGIALDPVLGSLATDTLGGIGPAPLAAGDGLPLHGPAAGTAAVERTRAPRIPLPTPGQTVELGIMLGPRNEWFAEDALWVLVEQEWEVTPRSDRVGVRLAGERPLVRAREGELESEGAVTGAIQVPPDGQPVLFLPDHPPTGGYPVIGAVVDRDLDLAGQLPPGARIRFRVSAPGR